MPNGVATAAAASPPAGVSKESIWKNLVSKTKQIDKIREEGVRIGENFAVLAVEGGGAIGFGILFSKFPQLAKIPGTEIDTQLAVGVPLALWGVLGKGRMSEVIGAIGRALLIPWLYAKGLEIGEKLGT